MNLLEDLGSVIPAGTFLFYHFSEEIDLSGKVLSNFRLLGAGRTFLNSISKKNPLFEELSDKAKFANFY